MHVLLGYVVMDFATVIYPTIKHAHQTMIAKACFANLTCALEIVRIKVFTKAVQIAWLSLSLQEHRILILYP